MICASKRYIDWKLTKQSQIGVSVGRLHHFHEPQISELENNKFSHKTEFKKMDHQISELWSVILISLINWWRNHPRSSQVSQGIMTVPCTVWSAGTPGPQRTGTGSNLLQSLHWGHSEARQTEETQHSVRKRKHFSVPSTARTNYV